MSMQTYKCHICKVDYEYSEENDLRLHLLYEHQFYLPNCSTEVANQANIDYESMRKIRNRYLDELKRSKKSIVKRNMINEFTLERLEKNAIFDIYTNGYLSRHPNHWVERHLLKYKNLKKLEEKMNAIGVFY